jgi:hypothetical protein
MKLSRNPENDGKKRPICSCGTEMTLNKYRGYYDEFEYWSCENYDCTIIDDFKPDFIDKGSYG